MSTTLLNWNMFAEKKRGDNSNQKRISWASDFGSRLLRSDTPTPSPPVDDTERFRKPHYFGLNFAPADSRNTISSGSPRGLPFG